MFKVQKKIIRIMASVKQRVSCTELFKKFNIYPLASEFLLSLLSFIMDNMKKFQTNSDTHNINTRHKYDLCLLNAIITRYKKIMYYTGIKLFSTLLASIKSLNHNIKVFKPALKDYLLTLISRRIYFNKKFSSTVNIYEDNSSLEQLPSSVKLNVLVT
jgi:hypothetical protein